MRETTRTTTRTEPVEDAGAETRDPGNIADEDIAF
jgi:hypothetical protein